MKSTLTQKLLILILIISSFNLLLTGCRKEKSAALSAVDSLKTKLKAEADSLEKIRETRPIKYSFYITRNRNAFRELERKFGSTKTKIILALNRIDRTNVGRNDTLVIPDTLYENFRLYSPFPFYIPSAVKLPKLIFVSQEVQAFAAYEYGALIRWGATSTGKKETPTKNGLFHTNWKAKETISTFNDEWLLKWYFNLDNFDGISIHEYELPGYPASHACVRLFEEDAKWLYYWAEQWIVTKDEENILAYGTPVIIFGNYDFDEAPLYKQLSEDSSTVVLTDWRIEDVFSKFKIIAERRAAARDSILTKI